LNKITSDKIQSKYPDDVMVEKDICN